MVKVKAGVLSTIVATVLVSTLAILGPPLLAHERAVLDGDDTAGPLDIAGTQISHRDGSVRLKVITYETWTKADLSGDVDYIRFDLDVVKNGGPFRCIVVRSRSIEGAPYSLRGTIYKECGPFFFAKKVGDVLASQMGRPDLHSLVVRVPWSDLWKNTAWKNETLQFRAWSSFEDDTVAGCETPDPLPPEHFMGTCHDSTRWGRH
jgi:hypothetical protein